MLKASNSRYNQDLQWVKMKVGLQYCHLTDHSTPSSNTLVIPLTLSSSVPVGIQSALVCFEVCTVGDSRLTAVDTSVFTTFYIGVLTNRDSVLAKTDNPNYQFLFRSSWGLTRQELGRYNALLHRGEWAFKPYDRDDPTKRVRVEPLWC